MSAILTSDPELGKRNRHSPAPSFRQMANEHIILWSTRRWLMAIPRRRRRWRHFEEAKRRMQAVVGWKARDPRFRSSECYDTCYAELLSAFERGEVPK